MLPFVVRLSATWPTGIGGDKSRKSRRCFARSRSPLMTPETDDNRAFPRGILRAAMTSASFEPSSTCPPSGLSRRC